MLWALRLRSKQVTARGEHTLVVYRGSERADAALVALASDVAERGGRLTVLALAVEEATDRRCCDTRSFLWNNFARGFAQNDLARARVAVADGAGVEFAILVHDGRRVADAIRREARRRGADETVLADSKSCLRWRERRRLRAESALPVTA